MGYEMTPFSYKGGHAQPQTPCPWGVWLCTHVQGVILKEIQGNVFQHQDKDGFVPACFGVVDFFCSVTFPLNFLCIMTMHG